MTDCRAFDTFGTEIKTFSFVLILNTGDFH